jgi:DNA modification methylase
MAMKPVAMITDPPYGVEYDPAWREQAGMGGEGSAKGVVLNDDRADWAEVWAGFTGKVAFVWHAGTKAQDVHESLVKAGFDVKAQIVWVKNRAAIGRGHYHHGHEPCFFAVRKGSKPKWFGPALSTVWEIGHSKSFTGHGTQKPVESFRRPMLTCTLPGDVVFEPFSGSGTCIVTAEMIGRICVAIELSPAYCDVGAQRWARWTGEKPKLMRAGVEVQIDTPEPAQGQGVEEIA